MKILTSKRLSYRLMTRDDKQDLFELDQDPDVMLHLNGGIPTSMEDVEEKGIPRMESYRTPEKGWGLWHVSLSETNEFLGWILIRPMGFFTEQRNDLDLEIGWRFFKRAWGKGYATEAARHLMQQLTKTQTIESYSAIAVKANVGSIAVMKKLGMTMVKEGVCDDPLYPNTPMVYYRVAVSKFT